MFVKEKNGKNSKKKEYSTDLKIKLHTLIRMCNLSRISLSMNLCLPLMDKQKVTVFKIVKFTFNYICCLCLPLLASFVTTYLNQKSCISQNLLCKDCSLSTSVS